MALKLYNTLTKKKEVFKSIRKNFVGMYGCGPTVYWYQHIGNIRRYVFEDILVRVLKYNKYKINHIINVTDVGHLTSDADEGEDKIEKAAKKEGKTAKEITQYYFDVFEKDLKKLNVTMPDKWTWATEHIEEQINLINKLEKKGYTYKTSDGIYFDTSKLKDYGKLARLNIKGLEKAKRIKFGEKKNKTDFALWKFSEEPGVRQQEWDSPWGIGFPGWHIECSAMSIKELGKQFDIHTGGIEHIPVHHTNEIAQSEGAFGVKPWVKYWMHGGFLTFKGGKMSKSAGMVKTISELEESGVSALAYRYFTYSAHYRKSLTWSEDAIAGAVNGYKRLRNIIGRIENTEGVNKEYLKEFEDRINDDLDMPGAVAVLWKLVRDEKAEGKVGTIKKMDEVFGLGLLEAEKVEVPSEIRKLVNEREEARKKKNFKKADELRDKLKKMGWVVKDKKDGYELEKKVIIIRKLKIGVEKRR